MLEKKKNTFEQFSEIDRDNDKLMEFIDGEMILSPSTAWLDISRKLELYQSFGVKEYWIVSPKNDSVQIFNLNKDGFYDEPTNYYRNDIVQSSYFKNLNVNLGELFQK